MGGRSPQASCLRRPGGGPAQPPRRPRPRPARRAARPRPCARRVALHPYPPGRSSATRPISSPTPWCGSSTAPSWSGPRRPGGGVRPRLRDRRDAGRRRSPGCCGAGRADARRPPRHVQHQLALPLLRPPQVSRPRTTRATSPGWHPLRSASRGTTTITPSRPRRARPAAAGRSTSRRRDPHARAGRASPGTSCGSARAPGREARRRRRRREPRRRDGAAARRPGRGSARAPLHGRALGRDLGPATNGVRPVFRLTSPGRSAHAAGAGPARRRPRVRDGRRSRWTTSMRRSRCSTAGRPPRSDRRGRLRLAAAAVRAGALRAVPRDPAAELRPAGRRHSYARPARGPPPLRRVERVLRAVPRRVDDLLVRGLLARRARRSRRPSGRSSSWSARSLRCARGPRARRRLRLGQLRDPRGPRARRPRHGHHAVRAAGAACARARGGGRRRRPVDFRRVADYRDPLEREGFDAVASIGMVEHVGSANIDSYARRLARRCGPGGRLLNHGIARLRHADPEAGPFSERFVFPDAAPLHLSRIQAALERRGLRDRARRGLPRATTRSRCVTGSSGWRAGSTRRSGSPARSACASGVYLRAARRGFEQQFMSVYQVLAAGCREPA